MSKIPVHKINHNGKFKNSYQFQAGGCAEWGNSMVMELQTCDYLFFHFKNVCQHNHWFQILTNHTTLHTDYLNNLHSKTNDWIIIFAALR